MDFLKELVNTPSPTSYETRGQRVWLDYVKEFADETSHDAYGNCVATLNKGGSPRIMLAGHADEIALSVNYIDDNGYIWVKRMGGVDATDNADPPATASLETSGLLPNGMGAVASSAGVVASTSRRFDLSMCVATHERSASLRAACTVSKPAVCSLSDFM